MEEREEEEEEKEGRREIERERDDGRLGRRMFEVPHAIFKFT